MAGFFSPSLRNDTPWPWPLLPSWTGPILELSASCTDSSSAGSSNYDSETVQAGLGKVQSVALDDFLLMMFLPVHAAN